MLNRTSKKACRRHCFLEPKKPPQVLYHGTSQCLLTSIFKRGLLPRGRKHVHLTRDAELAIEVGRSNGKALAVLKVKPLLMFKEGFDFYLSANGVWLTDHVPASSLSIWGLLSAKGL